MRRPQICAVALMFWGSSDRMLANMSEIDRLADAPLVDWSELSVSGLLPTGTVTLLLADVLSLVAPDSRVNRRTQRI